MLLRTLALATGLTTLTLTSLAFATPPKHHSNFYVQASLGSNLTTQKHLSSVASEGYTPAPDNQRFNTTGTANTDFDFGMHAGLNTALTQHLILAWGLGLYATGGETFKGTFYQNNSATAKRGYTYQRHTYRVMAEATIKQPIKHNFSIYYGIGLGWAHLYSSELDYGADPVGESISGDPSKANTQNHLAAAIDAGLAYQLNAQWQLNLGAQQLWLGHSYIKVFNYKRYVLADQGLIKPFQVTAALTYMF